MSILIQRNRFGIIWELAIMDGKIHFLAKDILKYFGLASSSQGSITGVVKERDIIKLSGEEVRDFTHITCKGMVVTFRGLKDFVKTRTGPQRRKGEELIDWVMEKLMKDTPPVISDPKPEKPPVQPAKKIDLFDIMKEQEMADLKKLVSIQSERMDNMDKHIKEQDKRIEQLEKQIRANEMQKMIHQEGDRKMVDADALIGFLEKQLK